MLYKLDNCCFIEVARDSKTRISRSPPPNDYEYSNRVIISPAVYYQSCSNIRLDESDRSSLYLDPFYRHFFKSFYIISDSSVPSHSIFTLQLWYNSMSTWAYLYLDFVYYFGWFSQILVSFRILDQERRNCWNPWQPEADKSRATHGHEKLIPTIL